MKRILVVATYVIGFVLLLSSAYAATNRNAVAVIIGNQTYQGGTPAVDYAINDAEAMKRYVIDILGYREGNVIDLRDATFAEFRSVFGTEQNFDEGKLAQWIRPGKSDVIVFYSGHGVAGLEDQSGYLLPVDGDANRAETTGYSIDLLYKNLSKIKARSVTVFLDTCFSGQSPNGYLIKGASGLTVTAKEAIVPTKMTVLTAAQNDQVANWDHDAKHGMFTEYLLRALYGAADGKDFGNGNGEVSLAEVRVYLEEEMSYQARRQFGRKQTATFNGSNETVLAFFEDGKFPDRPELEFSSSSSLAAKNIIPIDDTMYVLKKAKMRKEPSAKSDVLGFIKKGENVNVIGKVKDANWYLIEEEGEAVGYVYGDLLSDDLPQTASLTVPTQPVRPLVRVFNVSPVLHENKELTFATDIIHRILSNVPNSKISRGQAKPTDTVVSAMILRFDTQMIKNPEYEGAQMANKIFGGLLGSLIKNVKPDFTIYDVEVMVSSIDRANGEKTTVSGRSMVRADNYPNQKTAMAQALSKAFSDGAARLVVRLSGGVSPPWQPPDILPKRESTVQSDYQERN